MILQVNPKISVVCVTYNHEKFIAKFMDSLFRQTEQDFELIILDDCSTDNNFKELEKFSDPRIRLLKHDYNKGPNAGLNFAIPLARGEYITLFASDDLFMEHHLKDVVDFFDSHPDIDIRYTSLIPIDENGDVIEEYKKYFIAKSRSRFELLHHIFMKGNCILSPGIAVRKNVLLKALPLPVSYVQHQDTAMHLRFLLNGNSMYFEEKPSVLYRSHSSSLSSNTNANFLRWAEETQLMDYFLKIDDFALLKQIFPKELKDIQSADKKFFPFILGKLALSSDLASKKEWGIHNIMNSFFTTNQFDELNRKYGFNFKQYLQLTNEIKNIEADDRYMKLKKKCMKYKKLVRILTIVLLIFAVSLFLSVSNFSF